MPLTNGTLKNTKGNPMNEVAIKQDALITPDTITISDVKKYFSDTATEKEVMIFLQLCKSFQLNPFKREIYLVKYPGSPASIITGYEVYLKRAERSAHYAGFDVWTEGSVQEGNLRACIEVRRKDWDKPLKHQVDYDEYVQYTKEGKVTKFWKLKPKTMIKKVVISQAFRWAFPDELAGMPYTQDEIGVETIDVEPAPKGKPTLAPPQPKEEDVADEPSVEPINQAIEAMAASDEMRMASQAEVKALMMTAKNNRWSVADFNKQLENLGYHDHNLAQLNVWDYETLMEQFGKPKPNGGQETGARPGAVNLRTKRA